MSGHRRVRVLGLAASLAMAGCASDDDASDTTSPSIGPTGDSSTSQTGDTTSASSATSVPDTSTDDRRRPPATAATVVAPASAALPEPSSANTSGAATSAPLASAPGATGADGSLASDPMESVVLVPELVALLEGLPAWLADPTTVSEAAFDAAFLGDVPIDEVRSGLASLGGGAWTVSDVQGITPQYATAIVSGPNGSLLADIEIGADGRIIRLFFENAGLREPPASMDALIEQLTSAGERAGLVVAEVADGDCTATTELNADDVLPIASTFKLYVLGAVATAIAQGTVTWEQPVTIRPELRSPGVPLDVADGETLTVRDLAQLMIEASDNTATDHLIDVVGRESVETMLTTFGHHDPAMTLPLLTTREMSVLKTTPDLLERYLAADETGRRDLLSSEVAAPPTPGDADAWTEPRAVFDVEWFATPNDLCRALAGLHGLSTQAGLEPIVEIMTTNPGMVTDPARIISLWFKGGSEPGVLVGAWLAERADGSWFVAAGGAASSSAPIDPAAIELVGSAINLS